MTLLWIGMAIFASGCFGGVVKALMVDKGLKMPRVEKTHDGETIVRPRWIGNMIIGGFAALILWGLYGAGSQFKIIVGPEDANAYRSRAPRGHGVDFGASCL